MSLPAFKKTVELVPLIIFSFLVSSLSSCGGGGDSEQKVEQDTQERTQTITGRILDSASGNGVQNASIWTDPPTSTTTSNAEGNYSIEDGLDRSFNQYRVYANAPGYATNNSIVSVSSGGFTTAEIPLHIQKAGLNTAPQTLRFSKTESSKTFYLTSTINSSKFSIESTASWLNVTPVDGSITNANGERKTINVTVNRSGLSAGIYTGELAINSSNVVGTTLSVIMAADVDLDGPGPGETTILLKNDSATVAAGASIDILPLDNDTGSSLQITDNTLPTKGDIVFSRNSFKYTANLDATGVDSFDYTVVDSNGDSATASVIIEITTEKEPEKPFANNTVENQGFRIEPGICEISVATLTCHFTITNLEDSGKFSVFSGNVNGDLTRVIDSGNEYRGSKIYFGSDSGNRSATASLLTNIGVKAKVTIENIPTNATNFQAFEIQFLDGWTSGERFSVQFSNIHVVNRNN